MKIVFTGGPSAGKTDITKIIAKEFFKEVVFVPEAASILFRGGFPRKVEAANVQTQQIAIYHVQLALETIAEYKNEEKAIVCDRGTVDGLAYWPESGADLFRSVHSSLNKELKRYDWVIHLDTPRANLYAYNNSERTESPKEAMIVNEKIKQIWKKHPQRFIIPSSKTFSAKVSLALHIVRGILVRSSYKELSEELKSML